MCAQLALAEIRGITLEDEFLHDLVCSGMRLSKPRTHILAVAFDQDGSSTGREMKPIDQQGWFSVGIAPWDTLALGWWRWAFTSRSLRMIAYKMNILLRPGMSVSLRGGRHVHVSCITQALVLVIHYLGWFYNDVSVVVLKLELVELISMYHCKLCKGPIHCFHLVASCHNRSISSCSLGGQIPRWAKWGFRRLLSDEIQALLNSSSWSWLFTSILLIFLFLLFNSLDLSDVQNFVIIRAQPLVFNQISSSRRTSWWWLDYDLLVRWGNRLVKNSGFGFLGKRVQFTYAATSWERHRWSHPITPKRWGWPTLSII